MKLVIVESPSKAKTIAKYLGKDYKVEASVGHICDLKIGDKDYPLGIKLDNNFEPIYAISPGKTKVISRLKKDAKEAEEVYLATDPDREGEAISYHLFRELNLKEENTKRLEFHEITYPAIQKAKDEARDINMELFHSQETRRILDRIIGFDLSQLVKRKIQAKAAGRVQSVVLKIIVDREEEIKNFKVETYYTLKGTLKINKKNVNVTLVDDKNEALKFDNLENALSAKKAIEESNIQVSSIKEEEKTSHSYPVYTTSTLLQDASSLLKFNSAKTMKVAQRLYEGLELEKGKGPVGLITYMRTDSVRISPIFINNCKENIKNEYGENYVGVAKIFNSGKDANIQDAHEGIRPSDISIDPSKLNKPDLKDEYKLYNMIYTRARASMMKDEIYKHTEVLFKASDYTLKATGDEQIFDGYTLEYKKLRQTKRVPLPTTINKDSKITESSFKEEKGETHAPSRYNEASLIQIMKNEGIGRPSTYATTLSIIGKHEYVTTEKGYFIPTEKGVQTVHFLVEHFPSLVNIKYTSSMETQLDEIADGKALELDVLNDFYKDFTDLLAKAKKIIIETPIQTEPEEDYGVCPDCGKPLVKRKSKYGEFLACSGYPTCKHVEPISKEVKYCPQCGSILVERKGKFGSFYGCKNYPTCKYIEKKK